MLGYKEFRFLVAGSGPLEAEVQKAENRLDNLVYLGKLLPAQLIPIYGLCDIGLQTYSPGSNVDMCDKFYDYTAAGLAVINSLTGEVSEHIEKNRAGINYVAGDVDELFKAIVHFQDKNELEICKSNSFALGMTFDKNKQNEKLLYVIKQIIER